MTKRRAIRIPLSALLALPVLLAVGCLASGPLEPTDLEAPPFDLLDKDTATTQEARAQSPSSHCARARAA